MVKIRTAKRKRLNPTAIFDEVQAQPPLMRPQAARAYQGMEGDWSLTFANAQEGRSGEAHLYFNFEPHGMKLIRGNVPLRKYPQLRQLQVGAPVRVHGRIQKVDTFFINLEIRDLVFAKTAEVPQSGTLLTFKGSSGV
ncbi:MAG: hypothetical protein HYZ91_02325 [Candidatus Omnitrophica bacterium]|nr:hypothetical protein [Candidatus Omnitrophota bacterium]